MLHSCTLCMAWRRAAHVCARSHGVRGGGGAKKRASPVDDVLYGAGAARKPRNSALFNLLCDICAPTEIPPAARVFFRRCGAVFPRRRPRPRFAPPRQARAHIRRTPRFRLLARPPHTAQPARPPTPATASRSRRPPGPPTRVRTAAPLVLPRRAARAPRAASFALAPWSCGRLISKAAL